MALPPSPCSTSITRTSPPKQLEFSPANSAAWAKTWAPSFNAQSNTRARFGPLEIVPGDIDAADRPLSPQELAGRVLSIKTEWPNPAHLQLRFKLLGGFHILRDQFSITASAADFQLKIPPGQARKLAFDDAPISLLEGEFTVDVLFPQKPQKSADFSITFQACDDSACLPKSALKITATPP